LVVTELQIDFECKLQCHSFCVLNDWQLQIHDSNTAEPQHNRFNHNSIIRSSKYSKYSGENFFILISCRTLLDAIPPRADWNVGAGSGMRRCIG
jgi:hypothetical protein